MITEVQSEEERSLQEEEEQTDNVEEGTQCVNVSEEVEFLNNQSFEHSDGAEDLIFMSSDDPMDSMEKDYFQAVRGELFGYEGGVSFGDFPAEYVSQINNDGCVVFPNSISDTTPPYEQYVEYSSNQELNESLNEGQPQERNSKHIRW